MCMCVLVGGGRCVVAVSRKMPALVEVLKGMFVGQCERYSVVNLIRLSVSP